jgi:hypothetical protein
MMLDLQIWCEFAAEMADAKLESGPLRNEGGLLTFFSYRYKCGRYQGFVNVWLKRPTAKTDKWPVHGENVEPYLYKLKSEVRESPGPRVPVWVERPDGNRWELGQPADPKRH